MHGRASSLAQERDYLTIAAALVESVLVRRETFHVRNPAMRLGVAVIGVGSEHAGVGGGGDPEAAEDAGGDTGSNGEARPAGEGDEGGDGNGSETTNWRRKAASYDDDVPVVPVGGQLSAHNYFKNHPLNQDPRVETTRCSQCGWVLDRKFDVLAEEKRRAAALRAKAPPEEVSPGGIFGGFFGGLFGGNKGGPPQTANNQEQQQPKQEDPTADLVLEGEHQIFKFTRSIRG